MCKMSPMDAQLVNSTERRIVETRGGWSVFEGRRLVAEFRNHSDAMECAGFPALLVAARAALTSMPALSGTVRVPLRSILTAGLERVGHRG